MAIEEHQQRLGQRLRDIRHQQGMTLQDVEQASDGRWKAVVVGAYERGDRAISAPKLIELADFYAVPVSALLADERDDAPGSGNLTGRLRLDLEALADRGGERARAVRRYVRDVQARRGDFNGRVLTLRRGDLRALAAALEMTAPQLVATLAADGLLLGVSEDDEDRLEVVLRVDGRESRRSVEIDPVDGTMRLLNEDRV